MADILLYGKGKAQTEELHDHDVNLDRFLQRCRQLGIRLKRKRQYSKREMIFLGQKIGQHGLAADPEKVASIVKMDIPKCIRYRDKQEWSTINTLTKTEVMRTLKDLTLNAL